MSPSAMGELAQESVDVLRSDERVLAVLLFGSAARGQEEETSDLDLLVLYQDQVPEEKLDELDERLSLSFYDYERLAALPQRSPLFAIHLAREGRALFDPDGRFASALAPVGKLGGAEAVRLAALTVRRLELLLADPGFGPADELSAGQLYALVKQAALLVSAWRGEFVFDRRQAFEDLADMDRWFRADLEQVAQLEPAWLAFRPTNDIEWTGQDLFDDEVTAAAVRVIRRVADVGA